MLGSESLWPPYEVDRSRERLDSLFGITEQLLSDGGDSVEQILPEISRLLVVRCSGHIETTLSCCFLAFVARHSKSVIAGYIEGTYKKWQNPKPEYIKQLFHKVSPELELSFAAFLNNDDTNYGSSLGSLVSERDKISHGDNDRVTARSAMNYYRVTIAITDWLLLTFEPEGKADELVKQRDRNVEPDL